MRRGFLRHTAVLLCLAFAALLLFAQAPALPPTPVAPAQPTAPDAAVSPEEPLTGPGTIGTQTDPQWPTGEDTAPEPWRLFPQDGWLRVRGWLDGGMIYNAANPDSRFNGPYNAVDRNQEPMFNQAYLILERPLPATGGVGGRLDLLYGEDFLLAQSVGLETRSNGAPRWNGQFYGLAMPQAYGEVGNDNLSFKAGHFYAIVGYEGVPSVNNFFYSHAYSYQFAGPFTFWGGLATYKKDNWQLQAGLVNSWNTLYGTSNFLNVMAGAKYSADSKRWWSSFALVTGPNPNNPSGQAGIPDGFSNRTRYSWLVGLNPGGKFEYVFHHWLGMQENGAVGGHPAWWYGIDQYAYYKLTDRLRLGSRLEWFRDEEGTRVGLNRADNPNKPPFPGNFFSATLGLNWLPHRNLLLRPEVRYDAFDGSGRPFDDGRRSNQFMLGFDAILQF